MSQGEFFVFEDIKETVEMAQLPVATITLGENNIGSFGPEGLSEENKAAISAANASPEFAKKPTNRWICVDGRLSAEEVAQSIESDEADPQIAGGIAISETAAFYMTKPVSNPLSEVIAAKTTEAINDGLEVTVHGDEHGEDGCAANKKLRDSLRFLAANIDIVAPRAWAVVEKLGVTEHLQQDDVTQSINDGLTNAENNTLWDITPAEVAQKIVATGGHYVLLKGQHKEKKIRADLDENTAFAKPKFVKTMSTEEEIEQFAASFGVYKKTTFERAAKHGRTQRDAAQQVLQVVLYNLSVCKNVGSPEIEVDLVG